MYLHRFVVVQEAYTLAVLGYQMAHNRQLFLSPFTEEEIGTGRSNNLSKFTQLSKGQLGFESRKSGTRVCAFSHCILLSVKQRLKLSLKVLSITLIMF